MLSLNLNREYVPATVSAHLLQGQRECITLVFYDGRTITCTPDHKILTQDGYVQAIQLVPYHPLTLMLITNTGSGPLTSRYWA